MNLLWGVRKIFRSNVEPIQVGEMKILISIHDCSGCSMLEHHACTAYKKISSNRTSLFSSLIDKFISVLTYWFPSKIIPRSMTLVQWCHFPSKGFSSGVCWRSLGCLENYLGKNILNDVANALSSRNLHQKQKLKFLKADVSTNLVAKFWKKILRFFVWNQEIVFCLSNQLMANYGLFVVAYCQ